VNEQFFLFFSYFIFLFTNFVPDPETRYFFGTVYLWILAANTVLNLVFIALIVYQMAKQAILKRKEKKENKKIQQEKKTQTEEEKKEETVSPNTLVVKDANPLAMIEEEESKGNEENDSSFLSKNPSEKSERSSGRAKP